MNNCPYCKNVAELFLTISTRTYNHCKICGLIFITNNSSYTKVVRNLSNDYFYKYSVDQMEGQRNKLFNHILDIIEQKVARGKLLDVGTGCGFFLRAAKARGWDVRGIEPSGESVEIARQHGVYVLHGTLQDYKEKEQFDIVTFVNVLEYSTLPWMEIDRAKRLLKNGGLIYVRFVNGSSHSLLHTLGKKFRLSTFINKYLVFHFYSFKPKFIKRVLHDKGFKNITILNSPLTDGDPNKLFPNLLFATYVKRFIYFAAKSIEKMTCRQLLLGTSLEVTAKKAEYS